MEYIYDDFHHYSVASVVGGNQAGQGGGQRARLRRQSKVVSRFARQRSTTKVIFFIMVFLYFFPFFGNITYLRIISQKHNNFRNYIRKKCTWNLWKFTNGILLIKWCRFEKDVRKTFENSHLLAQQNKQILQLLKWMPQMTNFNFSIRIGIVRGA